MIAPIEGAACGAARRDHVRVLLQEPLAEQVLRRGALLLAVLRLGRSAHASDEGPEGLGVRVASRVEIALVRDRRRTDLPPAAQRAQAIVTTALTDASWGVVWPLRAPEARGEQTAATQLLAQLVPRTNEVAVGADGENGLSK